MEGYGNCKLSFHSGTSLPLQSCEGLQHTLQAVGWRGSEAELDRPACEVRPATRLELAKEVAVPVYLPITLRHTQ